MTPDEKTSLLKNWALEAGFDRAGVARLELSRQRGPFLKWLTRGEQAEMEYLARRVEARLDPRLLFEGCRSVICVALQYWPLAGGCDREGDLWTGVARYARGDDYHQIMEHRLKEVAERITDAFPGVLAKIYVDTGPVLERELAAKAGLGVQGKNTNLLHPEGGSWFLLGELFTSLELAPDVAIADLCGTCTRCLDECPTQAFPEPYRLDSNRCISYWTIEHRGAIPYDKRELLGEWVFGCDVCQEVCPVNTEVDGADHTQLLLPETRRKLDLAALLALSQDSYVSLFRGSAMKRAKLDGLQRNAAIAMGNRRDARYADVLEHALEDSTASPVVRGHAAWALGRIGGVRAQRALFRALEAESDNEVREEILRASKDCEVAG